MLEYENKAKCNGYSLIIGVDEAGRGPLAGPVVAAAVALKIHQFNNRIDDSKKLTPSQRNNAFLEITANHYFGVGIVSDAVIDQINILQATFHAMTVAVRQLVIKLPQDVQPNKTCLLVDGNRFQSDLPFDIQTISSGDSLSLSVACASIVAKVTRDRILTTYDKIFPQYGFSQHKGYPTKQHKAAIKEHGLSIIHRKTFKHV